MYLTLVLFTALKLDPLVLLVPIAAVLFVFGYLLQRALINPFINRPEHSQFMLLVAIALILVNVQAYHLRPRRAGDTHRLLVRQLPARAAHRGCGQGLRRRSGRGGRGAFRLLPLHAPRQGYPRVRGQLPGRARGRLERQAALRLTFGLCGMRRRRRHDDDGRHRRHPDPRPGLHAARFRHRHHRRARVDAGSAAWRAAHRRDRGAGRRALRALGEEHVRVRTARPRAPLQAAGHLGRKGA